MKGELENRNTDIIFDTKIIVNTIRTRIEKEEVRIYTVIR